MVTEGGDGWDKFYRTVVEEAQRDVSERLDRFRISLGDWFYPPINWPTPDWRDQLYRFVEHTRYYGLLIEQESIDRLRGLIEARIHGTGPFSELGPYLWGQPAAATPVPVQLAMGPASDDGTQTDATVALDSGPKQTMKDGVEVAGPGPATAKSFQDKVLVTLAVLDLEIAQWWKRDGGQIRSRSATGWMTFLRSNEKTFVENQKPIVLVDENYTVDQTVLAIIAGTQKLGPFRDRFDRDRIAGPDEAQRFSEVQNERFRESAATAGRIAETFYTTVGSLTVVGELLVTIDEVSREGFHWDQLLVLLPAIGFLRKGVKSLVIKLPGGRQLRLSGQHLEALGQLRPGERRALVTEARKAKTKKEALDIIKRGAPGPRKATPRRVAPRPRHKTRAKAGRKDAPPKKGKTKSRTRTRPKAGPGRWRKVSEGMPERARAYQTQITGRTGQAYVVQDVKFDGYKSGVLLEAKGPGFVSFIKPPDTFKDWFRKRNAILDQARNQVRAASGVPVQWHVADKELKVVLDKMFSTEGVAGIRVIHTPAR